MKRVVLFLCFLSMLGFSELRQVIKEYPNGTEIYHVENGVKQGEAKFIFNSNGEVEESTYVNGVKQGEAMAEWNTGKAFFTYVNGVRQGKAYMMYEGYDEFSGFTEMFLNIPRIPDIDNRLTYDINDSDDSFLDPSMFKYYYAIEEFTYVNGVKHGKGKLIWNKFHISKAYDLDHLKRELKELLDNNGDNIEDDNTVMIEEFTYVNGVRQGKAKKTIGNTNTVSEEFIYVNGVRQGKAKINNDLEDEGFVNFTYEKGKIHGKFVYSISEFRGEIMYVNGIKHGNAKIIEGFDDDSRTIFEFTYKNGKRDGKAKVVDSYGDMEEFTYVNGVRQGKAKIINKFGDDSRTILEFTYKNGKRDGKAKLIEYNGDVEEFTYVNGVKHGKAKLIENDGTVEEFIYINGKKEY